MKKPRLVLLGIDGMDYDYTQSVLDHLPNIEKLSEIGLVKSFKSVFPPDSIPSWITCYTGKDPSEHGILESVDYLAKGDKRLEVDRSLFKGKTFWDLLGRNGVQVCVINPFMAYPVWDVNGVMINGPVFISGKTQCSSPEFLNGLEIPNSLGGITDFPTRKNLKVFCEKTLKDTRDQVDFGLSLFKKMRPEFFFQVFLTMDRLQHFLWRYCDKNDPTYPGKNEFENVIRELYILVDHAIGQFLDALEPGDKLMVISDHGHGMRCTHCFNINEYLRRKGYLKSSAEGKPISMQMIMEKLKNRFLTFMHDHDLEDYISVIAKFVPNAKRLKKGKHITDSSKNKAYASDFTGTNPFGGICINRALIDDYDMFRNELIKELQVLRNEQKPVFKWICTREEMFSGPYLARFPDILFEMVSQLGVNWALHTDVFTVNPTHKKISGGHNANGVLLMNSFKGNTNANQFEMLNVFPSILEFYGIDAKSLCHGTSFLRARV